VGPKRAAETEFGRGGGAPARIERFEGGVSRKPLAEENGSFGDGCTQSTPRWQPAAERYRPDPRDRGPEIVGRAVELGTQPSDNDSQVGRIPPRKLRTFAAVPGEASFTRNQGVSRSAHDVQATRRRRCPQVGCGGTARLVRAEPPPLEGSRSRLVMAAGLSEPWHLLYELPCGIQPTCAWRSASVGAFRGLDRSRELS